MKLSLLPLAALVATALAGCTAEAADDGDATRGADAFTTLTADDYRAYAELATEGGLAPARGVVTVLGLRGIDVDGAVHATTFQKTFDDTLVVLGADGKTAVRFAASTHPFEKKGVSGVPDVDGDRVSDVGMIRPGVYDVAGRERLVAGQPSYVVTQGGSGRLPGWRDTDHDGVLSPAEVTAAERREDGLTDVLFHQGEGGAPAAVGCQVLPASEVRAFVKAVAGSATATKNVRFRYVLVDVSGREPATLPHGK